MVHGAVAVTDDRKQECTQTLLRMHALGPWIAHDAATAHTAIATATTTEARAGPDSDELDATRVVVQNALARHRAASDLPLSRSVGMAAHVNAEKVRVRMEMTGADGRVMAPWELPPTGRVFDSVPDAGDETAYDALEKAYNAAFAGCSDERLTRSHREVIQDGFRRRTSRVIKLEKVVEAKLPELLSAKNRVLSDAAVAVATDDQLWWKDSFAEERPRLVQKFKNSVPSMADVLGTDQANEFSSHRRGESAWEQSVLRCNPSVRDHAGDFAARRDQKHRTLQYLAEACKENVRRRAIGKRDEQTQPQPPSDISSHLVHSTIAAVKTVDNLRIPENGAGADGADSKMAAPDENKAMNDYLVTELRLYVDALFRPSNNGSNCNDGIEAVTSRQLCRDHRRAVADFDREWKRSHSNASDIAALHGAGSTAARLKNKQDPFRNPFQSTLQQHHPSHGDWSTFVRGVQLPGEYAEFGPRVNEPSAPVAYAKHQLQNLYKLGVNGLVVDRDGSTGSVHQKVVSLVSSLMTENNSGGPHLVIVGSTCVRRWYQLLSVHDIQVVPAWGPKEVRQRLIHIALGGDRTIDATTPRVILTPFETVVEDASVLALGLWQLCVFDSSTLLWDQNDFEMGWLSTLAIRSRQRLLVCKDTFRVDARRLVQFLFPAVLGSRRKAMAWNCAAFSGEAIQSICTAVDSCSVSVVDGESTEAFIRLVQDITMAKSNDELKTLDALEKQGMVKAYMDTHNTKLNGAHRRFGLSTSGSVRRKKARKQIITSIATAPDNARAPLGIMKKVPQRRRESGSAPRSRKRISRCGKCSGCLAEDCMECGHCKDMKKYGGPGLRKQSCKDRKCLNPKSWGLTRKKRNRNKKSQSNGAHSFPDTGTAFSDREFSDVDEDAVHDDAVGAYTSQESEPESMGDGAAANSITVQSDSESEDTAAHANEDASESTHDTSLLLEDNEFFDLSSGLEGRDDRSRASRTRVMRCGKCTGCTAPDCMSCRHCLDMKKYGGPGLRKQSCKNRKCIKPKVVMLNQSKDDEKDEEFLDDCGEFRYIDRDNKLAVAISTRGNDDVYIQADDEGGLNSPSLPVPKARRDQLLPVQDCAILVRRYLSFVCSSCVAMFSSKQQLECHTRVEHGPMAGERWEIDADRCLLHPAYQLGALLAAKRLPKDDLSRGVRAYAKLQGTGFVNYLLQPHATLGCMDARWTQFYEQRGVYNTKGLPAGGLDCHLGHDGMIENHHARIAWNPKQRCFTIECLSFRAALSVNGQEVHYSSHPLPLQSRDLIQIGAVVVHFLLPVVATSSTATSEVVKRAASDMLPRAELQAWLAARVKKRRAARREEDEISHEVHTAVRTARSEGHASSSTSVSAS